MSAPTSVPAPAAAPSEQQRLLSTRRRAAGLTVQEIADRTGYAQAYIRVVERGATIPTPTVLHRISAAIDGDVARDPGTLPSACGS